MRKIRKILPIVFFLLGLLIIVGYTNAKARGTLALKSTNIAGTIEPTIRVTMVTKTGQTITITLHTRNYMSYAVWSLVQNPEASVTSVTVQLTINTWGVALKSNDWGYYNVSVDILYSYRTFKDYSGDAQNSMRAFFDLLAQGVRPEDAYQQVVSSYGSFSSWSAIATLYSTTYSVTKLRYSKTVSTTITPPSSPAADEWSWEVLIGWNVTATGVALAGNQVSANSYIAPTEENIDQIIRLIFIRVDWGYIALYVSPSLGSIQTASILPLLKTSLLLAHFISGTGWTFLAVVYPTLKKEFAS